MGIWHDNPDVISAHIRNYKFCIYRYITNCSKFEEYEKIPELVDLLKKYTGKTGYEKMRDFVNIHSTLFQYYNNTARHAQALDLIPVFESEMRAYKTLPAENYLHFTFSFATTYFIVSRYKESLQKLNTALSMTPDKQIADKVRIRWLELIIHYESSELFVLIRGLKSMVNYLKKSRELPIDKFLCDLFKELVNSPRPEHKQVFSGFLQQFEENIESLRFGILTNFIELWLRSKVSCKPMAEVHRELILST